MAAYAALLRAVNLGPHNKVAMEDLRRICTAAGLSNPRTLLQSGNVVFDSTMPPREVEALLETSLAKALRVTTSVMVRTKAGLDAVIKNNPFPHEAAAKPTRLLVVFLKRVPSPSAVAAVQDKIIGREEVRARGPHLYIVYPEGVGPSRLTGMVIDRAIGMPGTGRNWNTVLKIRGAM